MLFGPQFEIRVERRDFCREVAIWIFSETTNGERDAVEPAATRRYEPGENVLPALVLQSREGQQLIDALWSCGLRPTEGAGSAGSLAATERHLADMRTIAFASLALDAKN